MYSALLRGARLVRGAVQSFLHDDAFTLAAALAFYSALSIAPLLVIFLWVSTLLGKSTQDALTSEIINLVGPDAGTGIRAIIQNSGKNPTLGSVSGLISVGMLLLSSTVAFGQLQHTLNRIWKVRAAPNRAIRNWLRRRLLSLCLVVVMGLWLLVSLALSTILSNIFGKWFIGDYAGSLLIFTLLFAFVFKFMPDARISWLDVWVGAAITAALFVIGKIAIGVYLGRSSVGSPYGAAGSLVVLLVWVYYSALIFFFGAEITQVWARRSGRSVKADDCAETLDSGATQPETDKNADPRNS